MVYTCSTTQYEFVKRPWARTENTCFDNYNIKGKYYGSKNLNERRKIEILKHAQNKRRLTKKQQYSAALQKYGVKPPTNNTCPETEYWGLTSACDVPGKVQILRLDQSIPLTNFKQFN